MHRCQQLLKSEVPDMFGIGCFGIIFITMMFTGFAIGKVKGWAE